MRLIGSENSNEESLVLKSDRYIYYSQDADGKQSGHVSQSQQKKDAYWLVYFSFYFLGVTALLPAYAIIMVDKYWRHKFRDPNNISGPRTPFQVRVTSYISSGLYITTTFILFTYILIPKCITTHMRLTAAVTITLISFASQLLFVDMDTDNWQLQFLALTLILIVIMDGFRALSQCAMLGATAKFPSAYSAAAVSGQGLAGVISSIFNIISISYDETDVINSTTAYFSICSLALLISTIIVMFLFPNSNFYKQYSSPLYNHFLANGNANTATTAPERDKLNILKKIWIPTVTFTLVMAMTTAILPNLVVLYQNNSLPNAWNEKYFLPVKVFLNFTIADYIGRVTSGIIKWPSPIFQKWILHISIARLCCLPLIMFANLHPRLYLPVLYSPDEVYVLIVFIVGFLGGYLSTAVFVLTPQLVEDEEKETANGIVITGSAFGMLLGVFFSYICLLIL